MHEALLHPVNPITFEPASGPAVLLPDPPAYPELLSLMYGRLEQVFARAVRAYAQASTDAVPCFHEAYARLAEVRKAIDPASNSATVRHMRALLTHIDTRLRLGDDRLASLREGQRLIAPVAQAFAELAEAMPPRRRWQRLHS